jgi:thioredoxin reductase
MKPLRDLDVAVVGGGPAGIGACIELSRSTGLRVALFEGDRNLGGIPRSCHVFFGMRDQKRMMTGPAYARRLERFMEATGFDIHRSARVLDIFPGEEGAPHLIRVLSPKGLAHYACKCLLLSAGCFEDPRAARRIPGSRPAGVFTTGTLQQMINLKQWRPGTRALVVGSEAVSLSSVLTLRQAGISIAGMVESESRIQTYELPARILRAGLGFPIYCCTAVHRIMGDDRVEAVELIKSNDPRPWQVACDTVVLTGKFRPVSTLVENTAIELDPDSKGPVVDMNFMTSVPNIFAAGNILRGADMHDLCALEGKLAGRSILKSLEGGGKQRQQGIRISVRFPIRYAVPQRIIPDHIKRQLLSWLVPRPSFQVAKTLERSAVEAWSGQSLIWSAVYRKIIANTRIPIPFERFDWNSVDGKKGLLLKIRAMK